MTSSSLRACRAAALALGAGLVALAAAAHSVSAGDLKIIHPWARSTVSAQTTGGAFIVKIDNTGTVADRLIAASTPVAERVELHQMTMQGNVMKMREVNGIDIPAGGSVSLAPGQYHMMMFGLKKPLLTGETVPMTLKFEKAGEVPVQLKVEAMAPGGDMGHAASH
jgi:hypothetical protein